MRFLIKLPAVQADIATEACIEVFHRWIQEQALPWLLIDVADYGHVVGGPGVLLVGHQADVAYDLGGGEAGLLYRAKHEEHPDLATAVAVGLQRAARAAQLLETAFPGRLRFALDSFRLVLNDRLAHANDEAGFAAIAGQLLGGLGKALGTAATVARVANDPRERLTIEVAVAEAPALAAIG